MYINTPIKRYLQDLAAKMPAPGGGSAAALSSAVAASLVCMAAEFTIGKEKYAGFQKRAKAILKSGLKHQNRLCRLLDEDVIAYSKKDMKKAIQVPAEVARISYEVMGLAVEMLERGNKSLASDAGLAVLLAEAGFLSGFNYAAINLKHAAKGERSIKVLSELSGMRKKVKALRKKAEVKVGYSFGR